MVVSAKEGGVHAQGAVEQIELHAELVRIDHLRLKRQRGQRIRYTKVVAAGSLSATVLSVQHELAARRIVDGQIERHVVELPGRQRRLAGVKRIEDRRIEAADLHALTPTRIE